MYLEVLGVVTGRARGREGIHPHLAWVFLSQILVLNTG